MLTLQTAWVSLCVCSTPFWTLYSVNTNSFNVGQMKTVLKAKQGVCLCVSDDVKRGGKAKKGTEIENCNAVRRWSSG